MTGVEGGGVGGNLDQGLAQPPRDLAKKWATKPGSLNCRVLLTSTFKEISYLQTTNIFIIIFFCPPP